MSWLKDTYPNTPIVVDVEEQDDTSDNADYRILRKSFIKKMASKTENILITGMECI